MFIHALSRMMGKFDSGLRRNMLAQQQALKAEIRSLHLPHVPFGVFPPEVQSMLNYIHEHLFDENLTVQQIKNACALTNNNVVTRFRMAVGMGPREYIVNRRVMIAASVLQKIETSIYLVASAIGYTEEAFSKAFKRVYGCSPSLYRQSKTNDQEILTREEVRRF